MYDVCRSYVKRGKQEEARGSHVDWQEVQGPSVYVMHQEATDLEAGMGGEKKAGGARDGCGMSQSVSLITH